MSLFLLNLFLHFLLLLTTITSTTHPPTPSPTTSPTPTRNSHSTPIDPRQRKALQSLNIPLPKTPCTPPTTSCDSATPFRHVTSLTLADCSDDVEISTNTFKSLNTLTSLSFINCPIEPIRFPKELETKLKSFTCIASLEKLTGDWLRRFWNLTELTVSQVRVSASGPGVIVNGMNMLNSVTISHANLSGVLPKHWESDNISFIDLSGNSIRGKIPFSLTQLENLEHLNLSSNSINGTIPTSIGDLEMLKVLSLSDNSLSGGIPESISSLTGLMHLDLGSNQLNGTIPRFLKDMGSLRYLNLEKNNFQGVLPFNASFLKGLEVFKVGENSGLCYNHSALVGKVKIGIAQCDKHGKPMSPPPSKDSSADDSSDGSDYDDDGGSDGAVRRVHHGPSKVVLGVAIGLSSIVFLIVFLIICAKCCK